MKAVSSSQVVHCCSFVLFGSTGDLALRKILPAIYCLWVDEHLNDSFNLIAVGRRDWSDEEYRDFARQAIEKFSRLDVDADKLDELLAKVYYVMQDISDDGKYDNLKARLAELSAGCVVCHLAVGPGLFPKVVEALGRTDIASNVRVIIEKPFGRNHASATELNELLHDFFDENDIYRIDHYLGKETVKNILALRFSNAMFDPHFNNQWVDYVQITTAETLGMEGRRGDYYETAGALRDMIQNHMLQLMAFVAMDRPGCLKCGDIRKKKLQLLESIRTPTPEEVAKFTVAGQYDGYRGEELVEADSNVETYAAVRLEINSLRWRGVPFYLRTGKMLESKNSHIVLVLKKAYDESQPNAIIIRIAPNEGVGLKFLAKTPGIGFDLESVEMDFSYKTWFASATPEAYEHLILDAMLGDNTMFITDAESLQGWRIVDAIRNGWREAGEGLEVYSPGSEGPAGAARIFHRDDIFWL